MHDAKNFDVFREFTKNPVTVEHGWIRLSGTSIPHFLDVDGVRMQSGVTPGAYVSGVR
jgi:hypothetical protein